MAINQYILDIHFIQMVGTGRRDYSRLPGDDVEVGSISDGGREAMLPSEPPEYDNISPMEFKDVEPFSVSFPNKMIQWRDAINMKVIWPVQENVMDPLVEYWRLLSSKVDLCLSKVGNPLILSRFIYMLLMSLVAFMIWKSGLFPNNKARGENGKFSDHRILLDYARRSVDLSKLEKDWEYLSSMPHSSGTRSDMALSEFINDTFKNNGISLLEKYQYETLVNYPGSSYLSIKVGEKVLNFELTEDNFNPLSPNGEVKDARLVDGGYGTLKELEDLKNGGNLHSNFVLLLKYGNVVSEQVLAAQKYGASGILFVSNSWNDNNDIVEKRSVALPQYGLGNPLKPSWDRNPADPNSPQARPSIPSIPISNKQGNELLSLINDKSVSVTASLKVDAVIKEEQPIVDIIAKINGNEQADRSIIIMASRNSIDNGAAYPNSGTASLLSLVQLMQELRYKFNWEPLRSIYFISIGGSEFNSAGAAELIKEKYQSIIDGVYSIIDISEFNVWDSSKELNIETHPLLFSLFNEEEVKRGYNLDVHSVHHYGDWVPYLAAGVPVTVLTSKSLRTKSAPIFTKEDTYSAFKDSFEKAAKEGIIHDNLLFLVNLVLQVGDKPLIPLDITEFAKYIFSSLKELNERYDNRLDLMHVMSGMSSWMAIGKQWAEGVEAWKVVVIEHDGGFEPTLIYLDRTQWNIQVSNVARYLVSWEGVPGRAHYRNLFLGPELWTQLDDDEKSWVLPGLKDLLHNGQIDEANDHLKLIGKVLNDAAVMFAHSS